MILVSACLLGVNCTYRGDSNKNEKVLKLLEHETVLPVCPEQLGGLPTPRPPAEIKDGKVVRENREDVTDEFEKGAKEALKLCKIFGCKKAILKARSPSCGCGKIYDGTFSHKVVEGDGVFAKLLKENKIEIMTEEQL